jgi:intracellular sulfur oxidation DsrE/DsrF family protein
MSGKLVADFTNQLDIHEEKLAFTLSLVNSGFYHIVIEQTNGEFLYTPLFHHSK